jgi:tripeptidyl-peptidase-1
MLTPDDGWKAVDTEEDPVVPLTVALKQKNLQKLKAFFDVVSDPREATYGEYKSLDEIRALVAPSSSSVKRVVSFFQQRGFGSFELLPSGDFLRMRGRVSAVNAALATDMTQWHSATQERSVWRALTPYSLPAELAALVDYVSGVHHFPRVKARFFSPKSQFAIGPNDLRTRYNVTDYASGSVNNTQAVAEFQGQYYSPQDLVQFFQQYVPANSSDANVAGVIGPNIGSSPGVEAELDIQYIMGVNPGAPTYFYSQASFDFWSDLTSWIGVLNSDPKPPLVHSISYGEQAEHQTSEAYKQRFETEM